MCSRPRVKTELKFRYPTLASDVLASQGRHRSENLSFPAIGNSGSGRSLSPPLSGYLLSLRKNQFRSLLYHKERISVFSCGRISGVIGVTIKTTLLYKAICGASGRIYQRLYVFRPYLWLNHQRSPVGLVITRGFVGILCTLLITGRCLDRKNFANLCRAIYGHNHHVQALRPQKA